MSFSIDSTIKLRNGGLLPRLGLGVYQSRGKECENAVVSAIQAGYKHIDTAQGYHNENLVGRAIAASGVPRTSLFITTKYMPSHDFHTADEVYDVLRKSLKPLNVDESSKVTPYIDLMLLHAPWGGEKGRAENWKALARAQKEGWVKEIGVSNFGVKHLEQLPEPIPAVNQIELHPWCQQTPITSYCQSHDIVIQAYCPIARAGPTLLENPIISKISTKHNVAPTQVLLRWSIQKGFAAIPKSVNPDRIKNNSDIFGFELDDEDMKDMGGLDEGSKGAISWNPIDRD